MHSFLIQHGCPHDSRFYDKHNVLITSILQGPIGGFNIHPISLKNKTVIKNIRNNVYLLGDVTMRGALAIASQNKWFVYQMDMKSSFLNGILEEEIYVD